MTFIGFGTKLLPSQIKIYKKHFKLKIKKSNHANIRNKNVPYAVQIFLLLNFSDFKNFFAYIKMPKDSSGKYYEKNKKII